MKSSSNNLIYILTLSLIATNINAMLRNSLRSIRSAIPTRSLATSLNIAAKSKTAKKAPYLAATASLILSGGLIANKIKKDNISTEEFKKNAQTKNIVEQIISWGKFKSRPVVMSLGGDVIFCGEEDNIIYNEALKAYETKNWSVAINIFPIPEYQDLEFIIINAPYTYLCPDSGAFYHSFQNDLNAIKIRNLFKEIIKETPKS